MNANNRNVSKRRFLILLTPQMVLTTALYNHDLGR